MYTIEYWKAVHAETVLAIQRAQCIHILSIKRTHRKIRSYLNSHCEGIAFPYAIHVVSHMLSIVVELLKILYNFMQNYVNSYYNVNLLYLHFFKVILSYGFLQVVLSFPKCSLAIDFHKLF